MIRGCIRLVRRVLLRLREVEVMQRGRMVDENFVQRRSHQEADRRGNSGITLIPSLPAHLYTCSQ